MVRSQLYLLNRNNSDWQLFYVHNVEYRLRKISKKIGKRKSRVFLQELTPWSATFAISIDFHWRNQHQITKKGTYLYELYLSNAGSDTWWRLYISG